MAFELLVGHFPNPVLARTVVAAASRENPCEIYEAASDMKGGLESSRIVGDEVFLARYHGTFEARQERS